MDTITKLAHKLMLVAAGILMFAGIPSIDIKSLSYDSGHNQYSVKISWHSNVYAISDRDGDGVQDDYDICPDVPGASCELGNRCWELEEEKKEYRSSSGGLNWFSILLGILAILISVAVLASSGGASGGLSVAAILVAIEAIRDAITAANWSSVADGIEDLQEELGCLDKTNWRT